MSWIEENSIFTFFNGYETILDTFLEFWKVMSWTLGDLFFVMIGKSGMSVLIFINGLTGVACGDSIEILSNSFLFYPLKLT